MIFVVFSRLRIFATVVDIYLSLCDVPSVFVHHLLQIFNILFIAAASRLGLEHLLSAQQFGTLSCVILLVDQALP